MNVIKSLPAPSPARQHVKARAYRVTLAGRVKFVFIGPVRNRCEAETVLREKFGAALLDLRVHPLSDPWRTSR